MDLRLAGVLGLALPAAAALGWFLNNRLGRRSLEAARKRADELLRGARHEGEKVKQAARIEAKQETLAEREKSERDNRSRRGQVLKRERDLEAAVQAQREVEARLARGQDELREAEARLQAEAGQLEAERQRLAQTEDRYNQALENVSEMTRSEARRQLLANLQAQTRLEAAALSREIRDEAQRGAEAEATKIVALAIERMASTLSAERAVTQFKLPEGADLRGRIIGHEGKNIRAFEQATGIQLLFDEDGTTMTLSGYHPVRREIARRVLEALVKDGNIRPRRIEDLTRRNERRVEDEMRRAGQEAVEELGLREVHPEVVKLLGRLRYRTSYGQNVLEHSKEVAWLTGMMAVELRLDQVLARRAGLLHDIGKAMDYEREGTHPEIGAEVARKYEEHEVVINAIASHHEDCEMTSPVSVLVAAADAISGARPGARRQSAAQYIKRIEKLEELAGSLEGVEQCYALAAGREVRVIARPKQIDDAKVETLAAELAARIQNEVDYPGKIKVTVIRELRAVDYAR